MIAIGVYYQPGAFTDRDGVNRWIRFLGAAIRDTGAMLCLLLNVRER